MYALDYQLDKILKEGLENRYKRHLEMADCVRKWAKEKFELFSNENYLSNTVTAIKNTKDLDMPNLIKKLEEENYVISNGYGDLKNKTFRISHMGDYRIEDIQALLETINDILKI